MSLDVNDRFFRRSFRLTATAGQSSVHEVKFDYNVFLWGGAYIAINEVAEGDYIDFEVVDKDGISFPSGTVLSKYVEDEYVDPNNKKAEILSESGAHIPKGIYLRVRYTSVGALDVRLIIRYKLRVP